PNPEAGPDARVHGAGRGGSGSGGESRRAPGFPCTGSRARERQGRGRSWSRPGGLRRRTPLCYSRAAARVAAPSGGARRETRRAAGRERKMGRSAFRGLLRGPLAAGLLMEAGFLALGLRGAPTETRVGIQLFLFVIYLAALGSISRVPLDG